MSIDVNALIGLARKQLGIQYVWGGGGTNGPGRGVAGDPAEPNAPNMTGFDCSGLMQYIFAQQGVHLPRVSYDQFKVGQAVDYKHLTPGDMVFFAFAGGGQADHVALYIGGGKILEAPHTGANVRITDITQGQYRNAFIGGRRVATGTNMPTSVAGSSPTAGMPTMSASQVLQGSTSLMPPGTTTNPSGHLSSEDYASQYGWSYAFLNSNTGLSSIFKQAVAGNWTPAKFQSEVQNTDWWKQNGANARKVEILKSTDPATYQAQLNAAVASVKEKASAMGAYPSDATIQRMAADGLKFGYNDAQIGNALAGYVKFSDGHLGGEAGSIENRVKELAFKNGLNVTDQSIKNNAVLILKGQKSMEQYENDMRKQAASLYPAYEKQILAGENVSDIAGPYINSMATLQEKDPSSISVFDPTIKAALNGKDAKGQPIGMSISDFETMLRNKPGWSQTDNARNAVSSAGLGVLQGMGLLSQ